MDWKLHVHKPRGGYKILTPHTNLIKSGVDTDAREAGGGIMIGEAPTIAVLNRELAVITD